MTFDDILKETGVSKNLVQAGFEDLGYEIDEDIPDDIGKGLITKLKSLAKAGGLAVKPANKELTEQPRITLTQARKMQPYQQSELLSTLTQAAAEGQQVNGRLIAFLQDVVGAAAGRLKSQVELTNSAIGALDTISQRSAEVNDRLLSAISDTLGSGVFTDEVFDAMGDAKDSFRTSAANFESATAYFDSIASGAGR